MGHVVQCLMSHRWLRAAQVAISVQLLVCTALVVTVAARTVDAIADVLSGHAFALFDDGRFGFDDVMVQALWDQWFVLWAGLCVITPIASTILVVALRRASHDPVDPDLPGPIRAFFATMVPGVGTFGLYFIADLARAVAHLQLPSANGGVGQRISTLARAVPASLLVGGVVAFLTIFAMAIDDDAIAKIVVMTGLLLPLAFPSILRAAQLILILRLLRALGDRDLAGQVRASHAASVGA